MSRSSRAVNRETPPTTPQNPKPKTNARYHAPNDPRPFSCNLCGSRFASPNSLKRHFDASCHAKYGSSPSEKWDDHPSALTPAAALALPFARPFYPTYCVPHTNAAGITTYTLTWPKLSGWPTTPAELERKNAAHRVIGGSNLHFVDTPDNVYADVASDAEDFVSGEDPWFQLTVLHQCVNERSIARLIKLLPDRRWIHGYEDDVFLALVLHNSDAQVIDWLGLDKRSLQTWLEQASHNFFGVHVKAISGPNEVKKDPVVAQEARWKRLVKGFREEHVEKGCEGCLVITDIIKQFLQEGNGNDADDEAEAVDEEEEDDDREDGAGRSSLDTGGADGEDVGTGGSGVGEGKLEVAPDGSSGSGTWGSGSGSD